MTDTAFANVLILRALNEVRRLHPPTYVALRYLAESLASEKASSWSYEFVRHKYVTRPAFRCFKSSRFKKETAPGNFEYRDFLIPSPSTCLAEAFILNELCHCNAFKKPDYVYSYHWAEDVHYPYNFEHYINRYKKRNRDIATLLKKERQSVAIISDIEKFYPSIDHSNVRSRFQSRVVHLPTLIQPAALRLFEHVLLPSTQGKGIATGPQLSHVVGDLALAEFDQELGARFPGRYFRYVDDIVVIVEPQDRTSAQRLLKDALSKEGLEQNPAKEDLVSSEEWLTHGPDYHVDPFLTLVIKLRILLTIRPSLFNELQANLLDRGFNIPLERIQDVEHSRVINGFKWLKKRGFRRWHELLTNRNSIVQEMTRVRDNFQKRSLSLVESGVPPIEKSESRRRWYVQRLRFLTNRLLYLLPASELSYLRSTIDSISEMKETSALFKLLIDGVATDLLEMPGPAVATAAKFISSGRAPVREVKLQSRLSSAAVHSAAVLMLYRVMKIDENAMLIEDQTDSRDFLRFCAGVPPAKRQRADFSYLDEIQTLQLGRTESEGQRMLETRLFNDESVVLEALEIGNEYYI